MIPLDPGRQFHFKPLSPSPRKCWFGSLGHHTDHPYILYKRSFQAGSRFGYRGGHAFQASNRNACHSENTIPGIDSGCIQRCPPVILCSSSKYQMRLDTILHTKKFSYHSPSTPFSLPRHLPYPLRSWEQSHRNTLGAGRYPHSANSVPIRQAGFPQRSVRGRRSCKSISPLTSSVLEFVLEEAVSGTLPDRGRDHGSLIGSSIKVWNGDPPS